MTRIVALAVALITGLLASAAWAAEDYVVVESTASGVKVGTEVSARTGLVIPANARVVLLRADGQMVSINGPFQGVPMATPAGAADNRLFVAITTLVRSGAQEDNVRVAAVRAADPGWRAAHARTERDIMAIDVTEGGDSCIYDGGTAELIRNPSSQGRVAVLALTSAGSVPVSWPAGSVRAPWPKEVPLQDGGSYVIEEEGHSGAAITTLHMLRKDPAHSDLQRIAELADHGCTTQARLWLRMITADQRK